MKNEALHGNCATHRNRTEWQTPSFFEVEVVVEMKKKRKARQRVRRHRAFGWDGLQTVLKIRSLCFLRLCYSCYSYYSYYLLRIYYLFGLLLFWLDV
jgi:hypothetical protein